jgi:hypothetical protein
MAYSPAASPPPEASFVTGQTISVSGGRTMS